MQVYHNYYKTFFTFFMNERKKHKFWWQKNKSDFYKKKNKIFNIDDIDVNKILASKKRKIWQI